jgi:hypothetical protein
MGFWAAGPHRPGVYCSLCFESRNETIFPTLALCPPQKHLPVVRAERLTHISTLESFTMKNMQEPVSDHVSQEPSPGRGAP